MYDNDNFVSDNQFFNNPTSFMGNMGYGALNPLYLPPDPYFNENLLPCIYPSELTQIGESLTTSIDYDNEDRKVWLRILTDGIAQLGVGSQRAPSTDAGKDTDLYAATFLTECLKITCKLFSTLFPAKNFAETKIYGYINKAIEDKSYRTGEFFNWYTTEVMTEYVPDSQQALWWSVLGGSSFVKPYYDVHKGRIVAPYIMPQDIIISSGASSVYEAERLTHRFPLNKRQVEANFEKGLWFETKKNLDGNEDPNDPVLKKINQSIGLDPSTKDEKNPIYWFDETYTYLKINGFDHMTRFGNITGRYLPFRTIKYSNNNTLVGVWRNWEESDILYRPVQHIFQHKYFPGFNAYGLGMIHLALGLAKTETKIQQQILKAAVLSNMPNMIRKAGLRTERTQLNFTPGLIPQIDTGAEPLQNMFMNVPFEPPNNVIWQLKAACSQDIQNISIAREIKADTLPANTSATTILGILSTSNDMPNSLIKSYYRSYKKEFQRIFDLLGQTLPDNEPYPFDTPGGTSVVVKSDFSSNIKIYPTMDPANSSQSMQLMVNEILMNVSASYPQFYNQRELQKRILNTLKIQDVDSILVPDPTEESPPDIDPVSENMWVLQQKAIKAYKTQDHANHILIHQNEANQLMQDQSKDNSVFVSALNAHITEHQMWEYALQIEGQIGMPIPDDPTQIPPEIQQQITLRTAQALQQKQEQEQQNTPAPMDPSIPLMEENRVKEKGIELDAQYKQELLKADQIKIVKQSEREDIELQIKLRQLDMEEKKMVLEERRLMFNEIESERKHEIELRRIELDHEKNTLQIQSKSFADTLKYENDKTKAELDAQSKSFDTVMSHDSTGE